MTPTAVIVSLICDWFRALGTRDLFHPKPRPFPTLNREVWVGGLVVGEGGRLKGGESGPAAFESSIW